MRIDWRRGARRVASAGIALGAVVATLAGCDERADGIIATVPGACTDTTSASVTVTPASATIAVGDSVKVTAVAGCATTGTYLFSSTNPAVASVNASTGMVRGLAAGGATIVATNQLNAAINGAAVITVVQR